MKTLHGAGLALLYACFAAVSSVVNLLTQKTVFSIYHGPFSLQLAILAGTGTGVIVKYLLDRRWIFRYPAATWRENVASFVLYSLMSVVTTLLFWGVELTFNRFWDSPAAKYVGAGIGLTLGYTLKYFLDRRFVFVKR